MTLKTDSSTSGFFSRWPAIGQKVSLGGMAKTVVSPAVSLFHKTSSLFTTAYAGVSHGLNATMELGRDLRNKPVRTVVELGQKTAPVWNKFPGFAKSVAGVAALWAAPQLSMAGLAGYVGWKLLPEKGKNAVQQFPPIAAAHSMAKPLFDEINQINAKSSIVFAGQDINPLPRSAARSENPSWENHQNNDENLGKRSEDGSSARTNQRPDYS